MMKKNKVRAYLIVLLVLIIGVVVYFTGRLIIFSRLKKAIITQLDSLRLKGVVVHYDSLETDSWKQSLVIKGLEVKLEGKDSLCFTGVTIAKVEVKGIALLPLLLKHELDLDAIFLDRPAVRALNNFRVPGWKKEKMKANFLQGIRVGLLRIDSGTVALIDSTSCGSVATVQMDLNSRNLSAHLVSNDSSTWAVPEVTISGLSANFPTHFYKMTVKQVSYRGIEKTLKVDSVQINPLYSKSEFARRAGQQIDQFSCMIPVIHATGFEINKSKPSYSAHHVDLRFRLEGFRDKRFPRKTRKPTILPVSFLHQLPFQLQIDTLAISDSYVSYEEFPETGNASGKVFFNDLQAGIANISNRSSDGATMNVQAQFMNTGDLKAYFTFPVESQKPYAVKGSLSHFSMPELNAMLVPVAHTEIESGEMNEMKFHFQYNEYRSDGEVELSYANLKVRRLKKNQEKLENKLVSFFINMFVKDDMDKSETKEKRTGTVQLVRDSQRGIFSYWFKSVLSGVKSVFHAQGKGHKKKKSSSPITG